MMSDTLYRNRRLLVLVVLLIIVTGTFALTALPRQEDPRITSRFTMIFTCFPGASARRVEALVTEPIEREIREMDEVKDVWSTSRAGASTVTVEIREDVSDVDTVWARVRDRLSDLRPTLPKGTAAPELRDRETIETYALISALRWSSETEPNHAVLRRLADDLCDCLRDVSGTGFVKVFGAAEEQVCVTLDRHAAARLGLTPAEIAGRIRGSDAKVTAGLVRGSHGDYHVEVSGELDSLERIRGLTLRVGPDGQTLRLGDVARLEKGIADPPAELAFIDGRPGLAIAAQVLQEERIDLWAVRARAALDEYAIGLPPSLDLRVIFDQSSYVEARLSGLQRNFLLGFALVLAVSLLLMGWRSAIVVGATLPLTSLMVFVGLYLMDIPIHQMSVMGLVIALGILIDNAIIMTDEVGHRLRNGVAPREAIRGSVRFLAVPLLCSALTTVLAFMPMVLVPGPVGEFLSSIGISVALAIGSSLVLALTVVPALVAILGTGRRRGSVRFRAGLQPGLVERPYRRALGWMLRRPARAMLVAAFLPALGFLVFPQLREQFFPPAERDQLRVEVELPAHASLAQTCELTREIEGILRRDDEITHVHWFVGRNAPKFYYNMHGGREGSGNFAEALVELRTHVGVLDHARAFQACLDEEFPKALVLVRPLEQGPPFRAPIELRIHGPDLEVLHGLGEEARAILASVPDVTHTRTSLTGSRPKLRILLDEPSLGRTGLANTDVASQLHTGLEGVEGGSLLEGTEEIPLRVRLDRDVREDVDDLASLDLLVPGRASGGWGFMPLSAVGTPVIEPEEGAITHQGGGRLNSVQGFVRAGVLPSVVLARYRAALATAGFQPPAGYRLAYGGEQEERNEAVTGLVASVAVLLTLMVTVLVLSFGSFRLAGLIFAVGGLSIGLGMLALWAFGQHFGLMAIVGTMGLVGLAINDSIVVLAALRQDERVRRGDPEAMREVVFRSTRHVLSTTVTTIAGFLPLVIAGGNLWPPLAIAIAGGVVGATVLALFFVPAAYCWLVVRPIRAAGI